MSNVQPKYEKKDDALDLWVGGIIAFMLDMLHWRILWISLCIMSLGWSAPHVVQLAKTMFEPNTCEVEIADWETLLDLNEKQVALTQLLHSFDENVAVEDLHLASYGRDAKSDEIRTRIVTLRRSCYAGEADK